MPLCHLDSLLHHKRNNLTCHETATNTNTYKDINQLTDLNGQLFLVIHIFHNHFHPEEVKVGCLRIKLNG